MITSRTEKIVPLEIVTDGVDKADRALDVLDFATVAVGDMLDSYTDSVATGLCVVMRESIESLREYVDASRAALVALATECEAM